MKKYGVNELRKMYLDFFESKDHLVMKSFSLVPHNDNSLLLINAGMAPLKPYFTGREIPPRKRVATCQKCVRTGDIENVGKTARHLTFFEMLGNFSFGDYFKDEAIAWSWEFLTDVIGLEEDRLYPSIYFDDDEAFKIWNEKIGIPAEKIKRFYRDADGKCDNFWEHGAGPCGPCSEIYYDRGEKYGCGKPTCGVGCDCDRYMEVWNNVFTQFDGDGKGGYTELSQKNIDTGMGLERLAVVVQDVKSVFDIDTMKSIRDRVCALSGTVYGADERKDVSVRLITDHIRSAAFMISDGIMPSNEGRGYVLRRLIRRAARHGRMLGISGTFLSKICETVISECADGYPELSEKKEFIFNVLTKEEEKFSKTIDTGLSILSEMKDGLLSSGAATLSGEDAFRLYDTYGFPLDLTEEILLDDGIGVDTDGFNACMKKQKDAARAARKKTNYMGADESVYEQLETSISSVFDGYDKLSLDSRITALTSECDVVEALADGDPGTIIVDVTPFYATMGGQAADTGVIFCDSGCFAVEDTVKLFGGKIGHVGRVTKGMLKKGDKVTLSVEGKGRGATARNHSATHLLQRALKDVLGDHVEQAGSLVTKDRLRFDFTHYGPMSEKEIKEVEGIVNDKISEGLDVRTDIMSLDEAKKTGAMALFGEKYGDTVRVVSMGSYSKELCGGTHVKNTSSIGMFKIVSEFGIASGVRRIEALTGQGLRTYYNDIEKELRSAAAVAKSEPLDLDKKVKAMSEEIKSLAAENEKLKAKLAGNATSGALDSIVEVNGIKVLAADAGNIDLNGLRTLGDSFREKMGDGVIVLAGQENGRASMIVMSDEGSVKKGAAAGSVIKALAPLIGGGGGGRPNMAQAGGRNPAGISKAVKTAPEIVRELTQ